MLQSHNSDKRQEKGGSPRKHLRWMKPLPSRGSDWPVSCHLTTISSFCGSSFFLIPSPSKTHKVIYQRAATSFMYFCAAQTRLQMSGLFVQWKKRTQPKIFIPKLQLIALRPDACLEERASMATVPSSNTT